MKTKHTMFRRGFTLVELLVVIVIIAALAGLTAPMVIRQRKKADQTEAVNNARQVGLALIEFENEYGSFPDKATADAVKTATGVDPGNGTTSNERFKQLFVAKMTESETMFFAKSAYTKKPDNITKADYSETLNAGEVGFGIIMSTTDVAHSSAGNPGRPICAAPFTSTLTGGLFDPDYYDGKAVVLKMDNSVASLPITSAKKVLINGLELTDGTGTDSIWAGKACVWAYPESK